MQKDSRSKKRLFWQIPVLLVLALTCIELWDRGAVSELPVFREVKAQWHVMRLNRDDRKVRQDAFWALGNMGPKAKGAVPALIAALDSSDAKIRNGAARTLGEIGSDAEAAIESLIRLQEREIDDGRDDGVTLNASCIFSYIRGHGPTVSM